MEIVRNDNKEITIYDLEHGDYFVYSGDDGPVWQYLEAEKSEHTFKGTGVCPANIVVKVPFEWGDRTYYSADPWRQVRKVEVELRVTG